MLFNYAQEQHMVNYVRFRTVQIHWTLQNKAL
jgi:hypothetical protein